MDHDELCAEIQRLQKWLKENNPTTEEYSVVFEKFIKLSNISMAFDEACDKQLERSNKIELERDRMNNEIRIKEKELDFKIGLETQKLDSGSFEYAERRRQEKRQAWWEIAKMGISVGVQTASTVVLLLITGHIEQSVIIGQHKWSLLPKVKF